jgi:hypothetical protein
LCEPLETTANGKRLVVEDSAACQKTIQTPVAQQVLKTDGAGNLTWTNGASGTVLRKDSTGLLEFATLNSVLQSGPVDLGSQPLTTTGAVSVGSLASTGAVTAASVTASGAVTANTLNVINTSGLGSIEVSGTTGAFIDLKAPVTDDYDFRIGSDVAGGYITTSGTSVNGHIRLLPNTTGSANVGINVDNPQRKLHVNGIVRLQGLSTYANNAAAISGGLVADDVYKTSTGELRIVV